MKSTWKFPFWVQENDGTVTQLTWSFLLVNPSLVADFLALQLFPSPVLPALNKTSPHPPPQPHRHLCRKSPRVHFCMDIPLTDPSVGADWFEAHLRTLPRPWRSMQKLFSLLGRPCSNEGSVHSPWEWFQRGAHVRRCGISLLGDQAYWGCRLREVLLPSPLVTSLLTLSLTGAEVLKGLMHSYGLVVLLLWGRFSPQGGPALPTEGLFKMESWCVQAKNAREKAVLFCCHINLIKVFFCPLYLGKPHPVSPPSKIQVLCLLCVLGSGTSSTLVTLRLRYERFPVPLSHGSVAVKEMLESVCSSELRS